MNAFAVVVWHEGRLRERETLALFADELQAKSLVSRLTAVTAGGLRAIVIPTGEVATEVSVLFATAANQPIE